MRRPALVATLVWRLLAILLLLIWLLSIGRRLSVRGLLLLGILLSPLLIILWRRAVVLLALIAALIVRHCEEDVEGKSSRLCKLLKEFYG